LQRHRCKLSEDMLTLRDCLEAAGLVRAESFQALLHKRAFAGVLKRHPLRTLRSPGTSVSTIFRSPDLTLIIARSAGPDMFHTLAGASRDAARSSGEFASRLYKEFPPSIFAIGGASCRGPVPLVERFLVKSSQSQVATHSFEPCACPALPLPRANCSAVTLGRKVLVLAGHDVYGESLDSVDVYCPENRCWQKAPPLEYTCGWAAAVAVANDEVIVLGGESGDLTISAVERYSLQQRKGEGGGGSGGGWRWRRPGLPDLREPRWAAAAAAIGRDVYIAGGHDPHGEAMSSFERLSLDAAAPAWAELPPLATPRASLALIAWRRRVFAAGGYDSQDRAIASFDVFDPATAVWQALQNMTEPRYGLAAVVSGGSILIMGGAGTGVKNSSTVLSYKPQENTWEEVVGVRVSRRCLGLTLCW